MVRFASLFVLVSCLWGLGMGGIQSSAHVDPSWAAARTSQSADSLLLDQYPGAYAAYSLRKLRSDYAGPVVRVRRSSDGAAQDIGFDSDGLVDTSAISSFVGSGDGYVTTWYAQIEGTPNLTQSDPSKQPRIAQGGTAETDEAGKPTMFFEQDTSLLVASGFDASISGTDYTLFGLLHRTKERDDQKQAFGLGLDGENVEYWFDNTKVNGQFVRITDAPIGYNTRGLISMENDGSRATLWQGNNLGGTLTHDENGDLDQSYSTDALYVGSAGGTGPGMTFGEYVVYDSAKSDSAVLDVYRNVTSDWEVGPIEWNEQALLPQQFGYQTTLYNWIEGLSTSDVTLPDGTLSWDGTYADEDELADLWLRVIGLTASAVTRSEPKWYVLDDGNGNGIEGTGAIKNVDEPKDCNECSGNPARSWENEPAFLYDLDIPLSGGGQGNPWYQDPATGRRALVVAMVDLMMHHKNVLDINSSFQWYDMKGKAMLGIAETYRWTKDILPTDVQDAFETGFGYLLDDQIDRGPRAVNTNMDMFALQGYADMYMATDDATLKQKCVEGVKAALFGYTDGELETNHNVFALDDKGGVFNPSGFIMEGDQAEVFYGGESIYHLVGALEAVTNRSDGSVPADWTFLETVVERLQEWRTYQMFYDPWFNSPGSGGLKDANLITAGAGFSGRTSYGVPNGQAGDKWKSISIADRFPFHAFKVTNESGEVKDIKSVSAMETEINDKLAFIDGEMDKTYTGTPDDWSGWSPWTKPTPYLPPKGWYGNLNTLKDNGDERIEKIPAARDGVTWNKTFGGPPTGKEWWSYKQEDANGEAFGFFVEAMPHQGDYGGWYGGKIETFWTESTGVLLVTRHGKTGCDRTGIDDYDNNEDSECFFNLDEKAASHVWGRDENGNGFTTLLLRGYDLERTSTFDTDGSPPTVTVNNVFNDPSLPQTSSKTGEETGSELEGSVEVENKFEAQSNGLKVTHTLTSDETDQATELWASLPVYLRHYNPHRGGDDWHENINDTRIEYWDGSQWVELPFDTDSDGVPEMVTTDHLRLMRDYEDGSGPRYGYATFGSTEDVRRSKHKYYDPYQTKTGVRTVHIDMHGDPGTTKALPAEKSVSYTIQTTDPTTGGETSTSQTIPLQKGWNLVSASVTPNHTDMDSIFADLSSDTLVVKNESTLVVKNEKGQRYWPAENVDEIGDWDTGEAYSVYVDSETTLSVQGTPISSSSVALEQGWNWVPYLPTSSLPIEEALSSVADQLVIVKDEAGRAYLPDQKIDKLGLMKPGEGYKIYVSQQTTLAYPDNSK